MFKPANVSKLVNIYLPLPNYLRAADIERLSRAFKTRQVLEGELNPQLTKLAWENTNEFFARFRKIVTPSHFIGNFRLTDKGIKADIAITDKTLIEYEGVITLKRRAFNDYWKLGDSYKDAPGFFGVDIFTRS